MPSGIDRAWQNVHHRRQPQPGESREYFDHTGLRSTVYQGAGGPYATTTTSSRAVYRAFRTYTIETDTYIYVAAERLVWSSRPVDVTINATVRFAIENSRWDRGVQRYLFLVGESGKERNLDLVSKALRTTQ